MDDQNLKFWQVVKKKPALIAGLTVAATYITIKIIDILLNWYFNRGTSQYGFYINYTVVTFYPVFLVVFFVIVTNIIKGHINKNIGVERKPGRLDKYDRGYTWRDIYKDSDMFKLYVFVAFGMFCLIYSILEWISGLSGNYAIESISSSATTIAMILSIITSGFIVVFLQNKVVAWLIETEKGNKVLGISVFVFGIITAYCMSGISYLWSSVDDFTSDLENDVLMGLLIPFDVQTIFAALVTVWLAVMAKKYTKGQTQLIRTGLIIAIVSVIISFTPLQTGIQGIFIYARVILRGGSGLM